ncbi:class I SAM-dependent methyltransferase [Candidatus Nomurabacteria bacterium]|nr:class I SAM-dependent methyltransferase [Candidatus Nomurabacteria bacterium]
MMVHDMSTDTLKAQLKPNSTIERDGIFVTKEIADKTVWDKLAVENPTHAVISAQDEAAAAEKSKPQIDDIKRHLKAEDVLLDCGTGYGRVAKYLLPDMPLGGYVGVDSAYQMLALFRDRYRLSDEEQKTPLLLLNADIHTLPLQNQSVDVVVVSAVFLHNHKSIIEKAMAEIKRVVKPGGTVLIYSSFPRVATLMGLQGMIYQAILNLLGRPYKNGPVRYYWRREIMHLFDGFTEVELKPYGYSVIPKSLIFLPRFLDNFWRSVIANPINKVLELITPKFLKYYCAVHFDVVAKR